MDEISILERESANGFWDPGRCLMVAPVLARVESWRHCRSSIAWLGEGIDERLAGGKDDV